MAFLLAPPIPTIPLPEFPMPKGIGIMAEHRKKRSGINAFLTGAFLMIMNYTP